MESPDAVRPVLEQSIDITAPVNDVWELVSDVRRMPDWSPQVTSTRLRSGFETCALGAQFTNRNVHGELEWTTHAEIVRFEPEQELAFRVEENWAVWSFHLEATDGGTRLTQRREVPDGISDLSRELTDGFMGGQDAFSESLLSGMRKTLARIKTAAEGRDD
ncbi:SRPBCC family protein [Nocardioides sp.]|uniref:SRPBCC family protein n=1 Tax=Nocardioides sp. TaxID=35761 RepID=UPI002BF2CCD8|nr:SRPBCC family protein [Nocardioides sp.]HXH77589.1 SRPBCC family protein [Nocardioides sp.]